MNFDSQSRWRRAMTRVLAAAGLATAFAAAPALAVPVSCAALNAQNAGTSWADAQGYSIGTGISGGVLSINNQTLPLPPNGIICVSSVACATSSRTLTFARNATNTPVYLLVEGNFVLGQSSCGIAVNGATGSTMTAIGLDRLGGVGGPGGSDGGSCDFSTLPRRAGEGLGPGGGRASATSAGGGGASPVTAGGAGFSGVAGGAAYASAAHRMLHGGSGGGCGSNSAQNTYAGGGGGGGVLVIAAGGQISLSSGSSFLEARGGASSNYGGGGGGGVVRLVADTITGAGAIRVEGSAASTCGNSSVPGGCGGAGLIKLEGIDVTGTFIANSTPASALYYGAQEELVPATAEAPTLVVTAVDSTWNGAPATQTPALPDPSKHVHRSPSLFFEAPASPLATITVKLESNNVAASAVVRVKMNALGAASQTTTATTAGTGSGLLEWTASLTVPASMQLSTVEAWIENVCTPGSPGCGN